MYTSTHFSKNKQKTILPSRSVLKEWQQTVSLFHSTRKLIRRRIGRGTWSPPSAGSWTRVVVSSPSLSMDASTAFPTTTPGLPWTPWPGRGSWWQGMTDWLVTFQGLLHQHLQWLLPLCYFTVRLHLQRPSDQAGDGAEGEERGCGYLWYLLLLMVTQYTSES